MTTQIGLSVQYVCPVEQSPNQQTIHAAIITAVNSDATVNLMVFADGCQPGVALSVPAQAEGLETYFQTLAA